MMARFKRWLRFFVFGRAGKLPVFYAVVYHERGAAIVSEATRSIHRARGMARELRANDFEDVCVATYYAESVTEEF